MSSGMKLGLGALVVIILGVGGYVLYAAQNNNTATTSSSTSSGSESAVKTTPTSSSDSSSSTSTTATTTPSTATTSVSFSGGTFSPASVTVAVGGTVTFKNDDASTTFNLASDPHPTHTDYLPLNVGLLAPGKSATVTFSKAGTFGYHNHLNSSETGTVVVK